MNFPRIFLLSGLCIVSVPAQERAPVEPSALPAPDQAVEPVKPVVEKLDGDNFRLGMVTFNRKTREIRFPAKINMNEGLLEFLVVHENGKTHESLLTTTISATHLNVVLALLHYTPSRELYALPNETGGLSGEFPKVPDDIKAGARLKIDVETVQDGKTLRLPVSKWIQDAEKSVAMPSGPWVYGGSDVFEGKFVPETTGDIIAIFVSQSAMINYPGDGNQNDDIWIPTPKKVPAPGTEVTVILTPNTSIKNHSKKEKSKP